MGITINIYISQSVNKNEWEKVYEESLHLAKHFPLANIQKTFIKGIETACLVPIDEQENIYDWYDEKKRIGWCTVGDYETMHTAEAYYMPRDLIKDNEIIPDAGDALLGILPEYMDDDCDDSEYCHVYQLWGDKTQGKPYHMYLLAIACMIESRLGNKAFVYGDITKGQCKKAVELANQYLSTPIHLPNHCDLERLRKRISKLPFSQKKQLTILETFYLGTKDISFGEYIRNNYSADTCYEYWKDKFHDYYIDSIGFNDNLKEYLLWGFSLEKLPDIVNLYDEENNPQYEKFIKKIMDSKLHIKNKNCKEILEIDQDAPKPYGIDTLLSLFAYSGAKNPKIDRYIPIEEIRESLRKGLGKKCNTDLIINEYLIKEAREIDINLSKNNIPSEQELKKLCEQDASEVFQQLIDIRQQTYKENFEKYDISSYEELIYYEKNDTIHPALKDSLIQSFIFYNSLLKEKHFENLKKQSAIQRCKWLVKHNETFLLRDKDWDKIFTDIINSKDSFGRYYPMMRVQLSHVDLVNLVKAIVLNDELYSFCKLL